MCDVATRPGRMMLAVMPSRPTSRASVYGERGVPGLEEFELPMSRADTGDYLGLTIETVSRMFSKLRKKEILLIPNVHTIRIIDWNALARLAS